MTLTITQPASGGRTGPLYGITTHTTVGGPYAVDDILTVQVEDSGNNMMIAGAAQWVQSADQFAVLGRYLARYGLFPGQSLLLGATVGGAVTIRAQWRHANLSIVETATLSAVWDPLSGLGEMIAERAGIASIDQVLAAVIRTFPPS